MKNNQTVTLLLALFLLSAVFGCKSSRGETFAGNEKVYSSENSNSPLAAETNKNAPTPVPTAEECPMEGHTFSAKNIDDGEIEKYNGCTVIVTGKLQEISPEYATILDDFSNKTVSCGGDFSSETYSAISHKLYDLKSKGYPNSKFPGVEFSAKVKMIEGAKSAHLTDCVMTDFSK